MFKRFIVIMNNSDNNYDYIDFRTENITESERSKIIENILLLVSRAAGGKDNIENGAIGCFGYGFIFKDYNEIYPFHPGGLESKVCSVGALRGYFERFSKAVSEGVKIKSLHDFEAYDKLNDLYFLGSLKTLIPTLKIGGYEILYDAWMLVKTPDNLMFPATLYWGASGTSLGGGI